MMASAAETSAPSVSASASSSPCAACKYLRRKCKPDCVFAPHFPSDQPNNFVQVHKVFGACNVSRMLNELRADQRDDCARSLIYEAHMRIQDPVHGCVRSIWYLESRLRQIYNSLTLARSELVKYQTAAAAAAAHANTMMPDNIVAVNMDAGGYGLVVDASASSHAAFQRMISSVGQFRGAPGNENHVMLRNNDVRVRAQHNVNQIHDPVAMASMNTMSTATPGLRQLGDRLPDSRVAASVEKEVVGVAHGSINAV